MPIRQIADNCGVDGSVVADEVSQKPTNIGYDANTGKYVDMFKAGIIDPLKVVRTALQNAASIAGLMLTTETHGDRPEQGGQEEADGGGERAVDGNAVSRAVLPASQRRQLTWCVGHLHWGGPRSDWIR